MTVSVLLADDQALIRMTFRFVIIAYEHRLRAHGGQRPAARP
ncbi:hypothetical protein ACUXZZ_39075 [Streptomyces graminifolii]